jgi:hypothetical protein
MSEIKRIVDNSASFYIERILDIDYQLCQFTYESFKPFFHGTSCLELGPASGYMTRFLVNDFKDLILVEGAKELYDRIPPYPNVTKHLSLFEDFDTGQTFDTIILSHVLEHIENPVALLNRIRNWMHDETVLLISVPNARSIHRIVAVEMKIISSIYELNSRDKELGHYRVYDFQTLSEDVYRAGYSIIEKGGVFLKPVSNRQIQDTWSLEMIRGFYEVGKKFSDSCAEIFLVCKK